MRNLNKKYLEIKQGETMLKLSVENGVWNPTPHGIHLGNSISSFDFTNKTILELGCGCGNHTILLAKQQPARLLVTEINSKILESTKENLKLNNIKTSVEYLVADWTHINQPKFDVLITNPPFSQSGKTYYRYFIDTLINEAHKLIKKGGVLIFVQSSMADFKKSVELMENWGMKVRIVSKTEGPFRDYYYEDEAFMKYIDTVGDGYKIINGKKYEELIVFEATI